MKPPTSYDLWLWLYTKIYQQKILRLRFILRVLNIWCTKTNFTDSKPPNDTGGYTQYILIRSPSIARFYMVLPLPNLLNLLNPLLKIQYLVKFCPFLVTVDLKPSYASGHSRASVQRCSRKSHFQTPTKPWAPVPGEEWFTQDMDSMDVRNTQGLPWFTQFLGDLIF